MNKLAQQIKQMEQLDKQGRHSEADILLKQSGKLNDWLNRQLDKASWLDKIPSSKPERKMVASSGWQDFGREMFELFQTGNLDAIESEIFLYQRDFGRDVIKNMIEKLKQHVIANPNNKNDKTRAFDMFVLGKFSGREGLDRIADRVASESAGLTRADKPEAVQPTGASLTQTFPQSERETQQGRMTEPLDERDSVGVSS